MRHKICARPELREIDKRTQHKSDQAVDIYSDTVYIGGEVVERCNMSAEAIKNVVRHFNLEVIQGGDRQAFEALLATDFVNRSAPAGTPNGPESMWNTFQNVLRPALSNLVVDIHDQIAEGDRVTTRKTISGIHTGELFGVPATGKAVSIDVIDIVRVQNGQYSEHWGVNTLQSVLNQLKA
jgi:predicted ester cyclase